MVPHEEIEEGVDDAVEEGQGPRQDVQGVDDDVGARGLRPVPQPRGDPQVPQDVVGSEKHREDHHGQDDQVERLLKGQGGSLRPDSLLEEDSELEVKEAHHKKRDEEPREGKAHAVYEAVLGVPGTCIIPTLGASVLCIGLYEEKHGQEL